MATGPAAGTTRGGEPPRLPGISQLPVLAVAAVLLLMLPLLKGVAPKKGEPLLVSPPPPPPPPLIPVPQESSVPERLAYYHVAVMLKLTLDAIMTS